MVALSVPVLILSPNLMYLPLPLAVLYLTHAAVTKVTRTRYVLTRRVKYKHVLNRSR